MVHRMDTEPFAPFTLASAPAPAGTPAGTGRAVSVPDGTTATTSGTGADGAAGAADPPASPFGGNFMLIMFALLAFMLIVTMMGPRKEKKRRETMLSTLAKRQQVMTVGGIIGRIEEIKGDQIVLKIDESSNTRITFNKASIDRVIDAA